MAAELASCGGGIVLVFLAPYVGFAVLAGALIYSLWRMFAFSRRVCRACGADGLIPPDSPRAVAAQAAAPESRRSDAAPVPTSQHPAPDHSESPTTEVIEHRLPMRIGGVVLLQASRELSDHEAKTMVARALDAGRIRMPASGETVTVRVR